MRITDEIQEVCDSLFLFDAFANILDVQSKAPVARKASIVNTKNEKSCSTATSSIVAKQPV